MSISYTGKREFFSNKKLDHAGNTVQPVLIVEGWGNDGWTVAYLKRFTRILRMLGFKRKKLYCNESVNRAAQYIGIGEFDGYSFQCICRQTLLHAPKSLSGNAVKYAKKQVINTISVAGFYPEVINSILWHPYAFRIYLPLDPACWTKEYLLTSSKRCIFCGQLTDEPMKFSGAAKACTQCRYLI